MTADVLLFQQLLDVLQRVMNRVEACDGQVIGHFVCSFAASQIQSSPTALTRRTAVFSLASAAS